MYPTIVLTKAFENATLNTANTLSAIAVSVAGII